MWGLTGTVFLGAISPPHGRTSVRSLTAGTLASQPPWGLAVRHETLSSGMASCCVTHRSGTPRILARWPQVGLPAPTRRDRVRWAERHQALLTCPNWSTLAVSVVGHTDSAARSQLLPPAALLVAGVVGRDATRCSAASHRRLLDLLLCLTRAPGGEWPSWFPHPCRPTAASALTWTGGPPRRVVVLNRVRMPRTNSSAAPPSPCWLVTSRPTLTQPRDEAHRLDCARRCG